MSDGSIFSLAERAFCSSTILEVLFAPRCEKIFIPFSRKSAIRSLIFAYPHLNPAPLEKKGLRDRGIALIGAAARTGYISFVICFVSPLGMLGFGTLTFCSYVRYRVLTFLNRLEGEEARLEWEKIEQYAQAFFLDSKVFLKGAMLLMLGSMCAFPFKVFGMNALFQLFIGSLGTIGVMEGLTYETVIILLFGNAKLKKFAGLNLALALRRDLGIVDKEGHLVEYSELDCLKFDEIRDGESIEKIYFSGWADRELRNLIWRAKLEFLSLGLEVQGYLQLKNKKLLEYYQFVWEALLDKDKVTPHLQTEFFESQEDEKLQVDEFVRKLALLHRKILILKKIHCSAQRWVRPTGFAYGKRDVDMAYYKTLFLRKEPFGLFPERELKMSLQQLTLEASEEKGATLYDHFKASAMYSKQLIEAGGEPYSYAEMLGLDEDCSAEEYEEAIESLENELDPLNQPSAREEERLQLLQLLLFIKNDLHILVPDQDPEPVSESEDISPASDDESFDSASSSETLSEEPVSEPEDIGPTSDDESFSLAVSSKILSDHEEGSEEGDVQSEKIFDSSDEIPDEGWESS